MTQAVRKMVHLSTSGKASSPLTLIQLEKGFARLEAPHIKNNDAKLSNQFLGRFGLRNAHEVMLFLKTPIGKAISAMMKEQILDLEAIGTLERLKQQKIRLQRRLIISLLLEMIYEKKAHAKQLNLEIQEDIDERLRSQKDEPKPIENPSSILINAQLSLYNEAHEAAIEALDSSLAKRLTDCEALINDLSQLPEEESEIDSRYAGIDDYLSDTTFEHADLNADHLQISINKVELDISSYAKILSALLEEGNQTEAHKTLQLTHSLHLKSEMLMRMKRAHQEERHFFNRHAMRVSSLSEADFMIPKDKTLALEGDKYYLYPRSKELSTLTPAQKNDAQLAYQHSIRDIMGMKMQVQLKRTQELALHQDKKATLSLKLDSLKQEINLVTTLLAQIQAARLTLQKKIQQDNTLSPNPSPSLPLTKPQLENIHRSKLTPERRQLLEKIMGNSPETVAKHVLDESHKLQARLEQTKLTPHTTPFSKIPKPY